MVVVLALRHRWRGLRRRMLPAILALSGALLLVFSAAACATTPVATPSPVPLATPPAHTPTLAPAEASPTALPATTGRPQVAIINGHSFRVEVADDDASMQAGLSGRPTLARDAGMIFVFDREERWAFWMKNVQFPLDILFLDRARKLVDIQTMQAQPGVPDAQLRQYRPSAPALYALEINAGLAAEYGFGPGMTMELR